MLLLEKVRTHSAQSRSHVAVPMGHVVLFERLESQQSVVILKFLRCCKAIYAIALSVNVLFIRIKRHHIVVCSAQGECSVSFSLKWLPDVGLVLEGKGLENCHRHVRVHCEVGIVEHVKSQTNSSESMVNFNLLHIHKIPLSHFKVVFSFFILFRCQCDFVKIPALFVAYFNDFVSIIFNVCTVNLDALYESNLLGVLVQSMRSPVK